MSFTNLMHIILKNINAPISWDWQIFGGWWGWEGEENNLDEHQCNASFVDCFLLLR